MKTADVLKIIKKLQYRYLSLLAERLEGEEKGRFTRAVSNISDQFLSREGFTMAQELIGGIVSRFGQLIVFGDQKMYDDVLTAIEAMKDGATDLESFAYILIVIIGDFHLEMASTTKTLEALLPSISSENPLNLGQLATRVGIAHRISNEEKIIKKVSNYEVNRQWPEMVGIKMMRESLVMFKAE